MRISIGKVLFAGVLVVGGGYGIKIVRGPRVSAEKRRQIEQLEKENEILVRQIAVKQNYLDRLRQNPDELDLEIKSRLGLVNPGSKSFILQDGTKQDKTGPDVPHEQPESGPRQ